MLGFPCGSAGEESACNVGDLGSVPWLGRSSGEGNSYSLQYSGLENSMEYIVHGVTESDTTEHLSLHFNIYVISFLAYKLALKKKNHYSSKIETYDLNIETEIQRIGFKGQIYI